MKLLSVRVNTATKAIKITKALKRAGRTAWWDKWYGFNGAYYTVTYKKGE